LVRMHTTSPMAREAVEYYDGLEHDGKVRPSIHKFYTVGYGTISDEGIHPAAARPLRARRGLPYERVSERWAFRRRRQEWLQQFAGKAAAAFRRAALFDPAGNDPWVRARPAGLHGWHHGETRTPSPRC
jgi:hypothetical protein